MTLKNIKMRFATFLEKKPRRCVIINVGGECAHDTLVGVGVSYPITTKYEKRNNNNGRRDSRPRLYRDKCNSRTRVRGILPTDASIGSCYSNDGFLRPVSDWFVRFNWNLHLGFWTVSRVTVTPHPTLSPSDGERVVFSSATVPRVTLLRRLPWAKILLPRWGGSFSRLASATFQ